MICYIVLIVVGLLMMYLLIWLVGVLFKINVEIFVNLNFIFKEFILDGYIEGWKILMLYIFVMFFWNSFMIILFKVIGIVIFCIFVVYGFVWFEFFGKKIIFVFVIVILLLLNVVMCIL